jgi:LacI family transcriptional regulator
LHEGRITNQQVGVLMKSMPLPNVFYSDVLAGIDAACNQYHLNLMFTSINCDNKGVPMEMPRMLQQNDCDGYLMLGTYLDEGFEQVRSSLAVPIVLVDGLQLTTPRVTRW